jgi:aryl-alcohol dehydrogenase-like predicted oxidoreductase
LFSISNRRRINEALQQIEPIARRHKATISQVVIACTLALGSVDCVIVGARTALQAKDNAMASLIKLSKDEVEFITNIINPQTIDLPA